MASSNSQNSRVFRAMIDDTWSLVRAGAGQVVHWIHLGLTGPFGSAPGTPRRTGEAAAGWEWGVNAVPTYRPTPGTQIPPVPVSVVDAMMRSQFEPGDDVEARNLVPHAFVLAGGRRFSSVANRMLGSIQAPGQPPKDFVTLALMEPVNRLPSWKFAP